MTRNNPYAPALNYNNYNSTYGYLASQASNADNILSSEISAGIVHVVNREDYTCTVITDNGRKLCDVRCLSPWMSCSTGAGMCACPEPQSRVVVMRAEQNGWFIAGFIPVRDSETGNYNNNQRELGEGDISFSTSSNNTIEILRDTQCILIKNTPCTEILLESTEDIIYIRSQRLHLTNPVSTIDMNLNSETGATTTTLFFRKNINDTQNFVKASIGTNSDEKAILNLNVSNKLGLTITTDGDVKLYCRNLDIECVGDLTQTINGSSKLSTPGITLETTGDIQLKANGSISEKAGGKIETSAGSSLIRKGSSIIDAGGSVMHTRGSAGGSPGVSIKKLTPVPVEENTTGFDRTSYNNTSETPSVSYETETSSYIPTASDSMMSSIATSEQPTIAEVKQATESAISEQVLNNVTPSGSAPDISEMTDVSWLTDYASDPVEISTEEDTVVIAKYSSIIENLGIDCGTGTIAVINNGVAVASCSFESGGLRGSPNIQPGEYTISGNGEVLTSELSSCQVKDSSGNTASCKFSITGIGYDPRTGNSQGSSTLHPKTNSRKGSASDISLIGSVADINAFKRKVTEAMTNGSIKFIIEGN